MDRCSLQFWDSLYLQEGGWGCGQGEKRVLKGTIFFKKTLKDQDYACLSLSVMLVLACLATLSPLETQHL